MIQNATRHTLTRAKIHLSEMKETFQNDELFASKLSDFVDSARSITFHMQKQYMMKEGFGKKIDDKWDGWYGSKEDEMKKTPYLRFLIRARNYSNKEGPIPTGATREISFGITTCVAKSGSDPVALKELPKSEPSETKTLDRWFWDVSRYLDKGDKKYASKFEKSSVIETCESVIEYLNKLVDECEAKFG